MDEDAESLEKLQTLFQREGAYVLVAADGTAALRLAKTGRPDLIISDLLLAGLDGYEVWPKIRADKEIPNAPVLVVSALDIPSPDKPWRPNPNAEWRLLSYDAFLPKPVDLRRLKRVAEKLLQPDQANSTPAGPSATLAIEDDKVRESLVMILREQDFEVETLSSLTDAPKLSNTMPPAILFLDCRRPDPAVEKIAIQAKKWSSDTAVMVLIDPDKEFNADWLTYADGFLTPPLLPNYVITRVNQVLEQYSLKHRTRLLSDHLITTSRDLLDAQQVLKAQNEELQHVNAKLREIDELKETLTSMVVHDLKTPLAAILGAVSFMTSDPDIKLSKISESLLTGAMAAGGQMVRLTETLLEQQRLEAGRLKPDNEPFHFPTVLEVSLQQVLPLLTLHRLTVQAIVPDDLPMVLADPHISQRILENLLDNAIKFSPRASEVIITVAAEQDFIKVSIQDQGPGIPLAEQTTIFEQFAQLKSEESSGARGGFGLGLAFCRLAIQAMGGTIWVESDGETGTKFLFTIPSYNLDDEPLV
jgi:signal transduction histidine kinase